MTEVEIPQGAPLTHAQVAVLDSHAVLNLFNVLRGELVVIGLEVADDENLMADALFCCDRMIGAFRSESADFTALECEQEIDAIRATIDRVLARHETRRTKPSVCESLDNVDIVCRILRLRAQEIFARRNAPGKWRPFSMEAVRTDIVAVLAAIEKNSRGRYRIRVNSPNDTDASSYSVNLQFFPSDGLVRLPVLLPDMMRDLIANARKYTPVGGWLKAELRCAGNEVEFRIADNGRGIPAADLGEVFEFGRRGSNVSDVRTLGGGFGLTKALYVTHQLHGHFYVATEVGCGTAIRICIPRTSDEESAGSDIDFAGSGHTSRLEDLLPRSCA